GLKLMTPWSPSLLSDEASEPRTEPEGAVRVGVVTDGPDGAAEGAGGKTLTPGGGRSPGGMSVSRTESAAGDAVGAEPGGPVPGAAVGGEACVVRASAAGTDAGGEGAPG